MYSATVDNVGPGWTWGLEGEPDFVPAVGNVPENLEKVDRAEQIGFALAMLEVPKITFDIENEKMKPLLNMGAASGDRSDLCTLQAAHLGASDDTL